VKRLCSARRCNAMRRTAAAACACDAMRSDSTASTTEKGHRDRQRSRLCALSAAHAVSERHTRRSTAAAAHAVATASAMVKA
jgi:hypothetical protein